jgi:hypothetical protein
MDDIDSRETGFEAVDWTVAQDMVRWQAFMNAAMNLRVPYSAVNLTN